MVGLIGENTKCLWLLDWINLTFAGLVDVTNFCGWIDVVSDTGALITIGVLINAVVDTVSVDIFGAAETIVVVDWLSDFCNDDDFCNEFCVGKI